MCFISKLCFDYIGIWSNLKLVDRIVNIECIDICIFDYFLVLVVCFYKYRFFDKIKNYKYVIYWNFKCLNYEKFIKVLYENL